MFIPKMKLTELTRIGMTKYLPPFASKACQTRS